MWLLMPPPTGVDLHHVELEPAAERAGDRWMMRWTNVELEPAAVSPVTLTVAEVDDPGTRMRAATRWC